MLGRGNPDLAELKEICDDIVTEDNRAAEVIRRLGALYKRGEMKVAPLDLNELDAGNARTGARRTVDPACRAAYWYLSPSLPVDRRRAGPAAAGAVESHPERSGRDE